MNKKSHLIRIITLSTAFSLALGLALFKTPSTTKVSADQHLDNYASYSYSGDYYDGIDFDAEGGMNGALRTSLTTLIKPAGFYTYSGSGANYLSTVLQSADEDPTNSSNMIYLYTRDSVTKNAASTWNREHVWPQSLSNNNWGTSEGGTDILHLRPTYESTNSSRNNRLYGNLNKTGAKYFDPATLKTTNDSSKMLFGYSNASYFEPLDSVKGDVARTIMYIWTTYTGWSGNKTYNSLNILSVMDSYNTLLSWHTMDQPDALEGRRNDFCETSKQKNRNPFVDHPELAWRIFGDQVSTNVKNACMAAYPYNVDTVDPTGITLNKTEASVAVGSTLHLSASLAPYNASGSITWTSSNTNVATVNNGLVSGVSEGNAVITARVSESISASCNITVTTAEFVKVASYDFSTGGSASNDEISEANMLTRINSSAVSGVGLSNIVTSVSNKSKVYPGTAGYVEFGFKLGSSSANGKFTLNLNKEVCKVVVKTASWDDDDTLKVGDAAAQTPGVAHGDANSIKTLTYTITSSSSVTFLYVKRGFIQSIDFYALAEEVTPESYINTASSYANLTAEEHSTAGDPTTITKAISEVSGTTTNGTTVLSLTLDSTITMSVNANGNNGKVYDTGKEWRLYQTNDAVVTISASNNSMITSVTFTFSTTSGGILKYGNSTITSGTAVAISSLSSVSFNVANSGSANNGQVRVTNISVTYAEEGEYTVDNVALEFGATIPQSSWDAINAFDDCEITDYGVMAFVTTPERLASVSTVEEYYTLNPTNVSVARKGDGLATPVNDNIDFSVIIRIAQETEFRKVFCVAPFIVVNDEYHFLTELQYSVNTLATYYQSHSGCDLSARALTYLATTSPVEA